MQKNEDRKGNRGFIAAAARGLVTAVAVALVVLAVCAALISSGKAPESAAAVMACLAAFFGALAGSVAAVKSVGSRALVTGLTVSGALFALMLIGAAFSDGAIIGPVTPGLFAALLIGGALGGFLSVRRKGRKRA